MSIIRRCPETGAIIFDLTPEELEIKNKQDKINYMTEELEKKLKAIDKYMQENGIPAE